MCFVFICILFVIFFRVALCVLCLFFVSFCWPFSCLSSGYFCLTLWYLRIFLIISTLVGYLIKPLNFLIIVFFLRCNCGTYDYDWFTAEDNEIRSDKGFITNESQLPVKRSRTLSTSSYSKFLSLRLGPLQCKQGKNVGNRIYGYTT